MTQPNQPAADQLLLDTLMELATPLLREALDLPPEQAAVTALGRRICAEVERIYTAGRVEAFQAAAQMVEEIKPESTNGASQRAMEAYGLSLATALRITAKLVAAAGCLRPADPTPDVIAAAVASIAATRTAPPADDYEIDRTRADRADKPAIDAGLAALADDIRNRRKP